MADPPNGFARVQPATSMPDWYSDLHGSIRDHVSTGRRQAVAAATQELVLTYWQIGGEILERQDREGYGARVIDRFATDLKQAFPGATGFSSRNLKYMRAFAAAWPELEVVQQPVAQLPWSHHVILLDKLDGRNERHWYLEQALAQSWGRNLLALQIDGRLHERSGRAISNFASTLPPDQSDLAQQATKDSYLFDFLGTTERMRERDVEQGLLDHVSEFLLELGQGFALVGRQVPLRMGDSEFHCNLLLHHLRLRCYVAVELTAVSIKPAFEGRIALYVAVVDDVLVRDDDASATVCSSVEARTRPLRDTRRVAAGVTALAPLTTLPTSRVLAALHRKSEVRAHPCSARPARPTALRLGSPNLRPLRLGMTPCS